MKIAVVGSGISGLVAAYLLSSDHEVTVFEANDYIGGHTRTVDVDMEDRRYSVDTGFIVFNERNYPNFVKLLNRLGVESQLSDMSFSVQSREPELEYASSSVNSLFAQRSNLSRLSFYRMIRDIFRFYRESPRLLEGDDDDTTLGEYLDQHCYSTEFVQHHIIPMGSAIWSSRRQDIREFPIRHFVSFFANHDFLRIRNRSPWKVVCGGSARYVEALTRRFKDRICLNTPVVRIERTDQFVDLQIESGEHIHFDNVVIGVHADQALRLLADPSPTEAELLSNFPYEANETILHTDHSLLPQRRRAWASWNYFLPESDVAKPLVTYYMNRLQSIKSSHQFCVTLNRSDEITPSKVVSRILFHHPQYTSASFRAQKRKIELDGKKRTYYCGAYWGFGFHEDGVRSALDVCRHFGKEL